MPIQTSYSYNYDALLQGMIASNTLTEAVTAYSSAAILFGLGLVYDDAMSGDRQRVKLPATAGETFVGVACFDHTRPITGEIDGLTVLDSTQVARYEIGAAITVLRKGRIQVFSEQAVNPEAAVFLRHTANGGGTAPGQFRTNIDTANAIDVSAFARWASVTGAAGLALLDISIP